ncbi:hypothetical protein [Staphylococcus chromogenes]|uniref:hypothetical protein n=1 Tax=Staphylococcus chromogenes TaxID=46126 RepID=UPI001319D40A|nr:hypothetical protein [Staphylococcus chromogenes]UXS68735.1 hypothetical protein MUA19_04915 [Staphylococcus chromogenes]
MFEKDQYKVKVLLVMILGITIASLTLPFIIGALSLVFIFPPLFLLFVQTFLFRKNNG